MRVEDGSGWGFGVDDSASYAAVARFARHEHPSPPPDLTLLQEFLP